ncbi:hypothetical protein [Nocardia sp. NPDC051981]
MTSSLAFLIIHQAGRELRRAAATGVPENKQLRSLTRDREEPYAW